MSRGDYEARAPEIRERAAEWVVRGDGGDMAGATRAAFRDWLNDSPAHRLEFELADGLYRSPELLAALSQAERLPVRAAPRPARPIAAMAAWLGGRGWPHLAGGALAATFALFVVAQVAPRPEWLGGEGAMIADAPVHLLETRNGQQMLATLPDGTKLTLGGGTTLAMRFTDGARQVELRRGDALFSVAHDASRPFLIATPQTRVRVLGTKFLVRQTGARNDIDVFEGTVRVRNHRPDGPAVDVGRGSRVIVTDDLRIERSDMRGPEDWTLGWVEADGVTLGELAEKMRRRSGKTIRVAPEIENLSLSGRFRIANPVAALHKIARLYPVQVDDKKDTIDISSK